MKDKYGLILGLGIAIAALVGLLFFLKNSGELEVIEYIYLLLILLIVAGTSIILLKKANILVPERFGVPELSVEQVIGILVLLPGAFFIGLALYLNKKGDV